MPATHSHLAKNFARIADGPAEIRDLLTQLRSTESAPTSPEAAWRLLITEADSKKLAHLLPGTVGKAYAKQYGMIKPRARRTAQPAVVPTRLFITPAAFNAISALCPELTVEYNAETDSHVLEFTARDQTVAALEAGLAYSLPRIMPAKRGAVVGSVKRVIKALETI